MTLDPPARTYKEPREKGGLRDVDAVTRAHRVKILGWALFGGLPMGAAAGFAAGHIVLGMILAPLLIGTVAWIVAGVAGKGATFLHMPSGSSTPRKREYSRAEALTVRGDFGAAIDAYELAVLEAPEEGEPYIRIARLQRDKLGDMEEALRWFKKATGEAGLSKGQEILARREMAELLIHRMGEPRRAAPELARLAETYPETLDGQWAREELARIKKEMGREQSPGTSHRPPP
jgi:tetratricopeptide (TPR) repeat protein